MFRNKRDSTLWDLLTARKQDKSRYLRPGRDVLVVKYMGEDYFADLTTEGKIIYNREEFSSPSGFSTFVREQKQRSLQNRTRVNATSDGWIDVSYVEGDTRTSLHDLRQQAGIPIGKKARFVSEAEKTKIIDLEAKEQLKRTVRRDIDDSRDRYQFYVTEIRGYTGKLNKMINRYNRGRNILIQEGVSSFMKKMNRASYTPDYSPPGADIVKYQSRLKTLERWKGELSARNNGMRRMISQIKQERKDIKQMLDMMKREMEQIQKRKNTSNGGTCNKQMQKLKL